MSILRSNKVSAAFLFINFSISFGFLSKNIHDSLLFFFKMMFDLSNLCRFQEVVEGCPVPVIIAGGKKLPEMEALNLTFNAIRDGASGVDMGRNIWQSDQPVEMIQAVRSIVHDGLSVENAYSSFLIKKEIPSSELETLNTR